MRRRPPDIALTRFTYSCAMSLKMSAEPHEPCILITIGDCATEIIGKPVIAAPVVTAAAPVRNLRRDGPAFVSVDVSLSVSFMVSLQWRNLRGKEYLLNGLLNDTDFYASKQRHNGGKTHGEFHHLQCFTAEWQS